MTLITPFILGIFLFLLPLLFLPITADFYDFNKQILLFATTLILFLVWLITIIRTQKFSLRLSLFDLPLFIICLVFIISTILVSPYKVGALLSPLGTLTILTTSFLFFLLNQNEEESASWRNKKDYFILSLVASGTIIAIITLVYATSIPSFFPIAFLKAPNFTPLGTPLFAFTFLLLPLSYLTARLIKKPAPGTLVPFLIILGAVFLLGSSLLKNGLNVLPYAFGLDILQKVLQNPASLLLGVGPSNFLAAFTLGKPIAINFTPYWNTFFFSSSSFIFTLATETGIITTLSWLILSLLSLFAFKKTGGESRLLFIPLFISLLIHIFTLTSISLFIYTIVLLSLISPKKTLFTISLKRLGYFSLLFLILPLIVLFVLSVLLGRLYLGEIYFKKSLDFLPQNKGQEVYNYQRKAISTNPFIDRYHYAFSQTNLALANSLAGLPAGQAGKIDKTGQDQQNITRLVQQSVNSGRIAVSLNRTNVANWTNLAGIYNSIIKFAGGAEGWAITSYKQAILLNPLDPQPRLSLGGVYYSLKNYDESIKFFKEAISLKPDWANAHYNLSAALAQKEKYQEAIEEMKTVLKLVSKNSPEYQKAQSELERLTDLSQASKK